MLRGYFGHLAARAARAAQQLRAALVLLCAVVPAGAAFSQTADTPTAPAALKSLSLEELMNIEVTSVSRHPEKLSRTASAIQVITAEDIRRSGASTLPEVLRLADNLDVARKNAHDWAISARGFNTSLANKLLVLIDGRTVYTPLYSGVSWDVQNYLLADIERIEVISGPGGTLWGANAVNGVINVITKQARDTQGAYLEAGGGQQLRAFAGARYGGELAPDAHWRVYASYFDRDHETLANGTDAHDAWHQTRAGFRIDAALSPQDTLAVHGDYYRGSEDLLAGDMSRVSGGNVLGRWTHVVSERADFSLQLYYDRTHLFDPIGALRLGNTPIAPAGLLTDDLDTYDVDFQHRFALGERHRLQWGLGYRHTEDRLQNAPAIAFLPARLDQDLYSGFVQDEIGLRENLSLTLGSKIEHNDYTGWEYEPSARLRWHPAEDRTVWAAISRAVRAPSRIDRDLYEPAPPYAPLVLRGATDFDSETVIAYELGYRAQLGPRWSVSLAAFYNDYDRVRSLRATPTTILPLYFANDLEGTTRGIEISADGKLREGWRVHLGYSPLWEDIRVKPGQMDINQGRNETADPQHRFTLRSSVDLARGVELDAALRRTSTRELNSGPTISRIPAFWDMDLRLGWRPREDLELSLSARHAPHAQQAEYGFPDATQVTIGRSVFGKIAWRF